MKKARLLAALCLWACKGPHPEFDAYCEKVSNAFCARNSSCPRIVPRSDCALIVELDYCSCIDARLDHKTATYHPELADACIAAMKNDSCQTLAQKMFALDECNAAVGLPPGEAACVGVSFDGGLDLRATH